MYVLGSQVGRVHHPELHVRLYRKLLGKVGFAASWRTVEQHAVERVQAIACHEIGVTEGEEYLFADAILQVLHACNIGKAASLAYLEVVALLRG